MTAWSAHEAVFIVSLLQYGVYEPNCGLDNVVMSWGHDEYMYQVCVGNNCTLPAPALHIIRYVPISSMACRAAGKTKHPCPPTWCRFHSFYAHHSKEAYTHLMNEHDREMLVWLRVKAFFSLCLFVFI